MRISQSLYGFKGRLHCYSNNLLCNFDINSCVFGRGHANVTGVCATRIQAQYQSGSRRLLILYMV